ncbi:restriction endonuclease subunit S [Marinobacter subterrani]|uniref:restriction endonuclease subunit S n=1 Tax=Marinobacter subterrani TaxID=1658765 RepID=UPI00235688A9|nr:restriction endonuclease subunit S [Marinobacter subterrani]
MSARELITEHLDLWTGAVRKKTSSGRGSNGKVELTGVKRLRELIFQLAVRGQLIEQNADDEPAVALKQRITLKKKALMASGELKKQRLPSHIQDTPPPFKVPEKWEWVAFGEVTFNRDSERVPLSVDDRRKRSGKFDYYGASGVIDNIDDYLFEVPLLLIGEDGANLINRSTPIAFIARGKYWVNNHAHVIDGISEDFLRYLCLYINAISLEPYVTGTAQPKMNQAKMNSIPVPLPPEKEQHRIVQKVDELMALCDRLEQQTSDQLEAHETLVDTLLGTLTQSKNATELADNWTRFAAHFDTLFTTEQSIDKLKQTILQLAVMGRLVEQDAGDEPSIDLLTQIHTRKIALAGDRRIKQPRPLTQLDDTQHSYTAPAHWAWASFQDMADEISTGPFGSMIHKHDYVEGGIPLINPSHMVNGNINEDSSVSVSPPKAEELSSYKLAKGDIVMARRGEVGRCALVTDRESGWLCGTGSFVLRFHPAMNRRFILLLFSTDTVRDYLIGNSVGTTMTNLNHGILKKMPVALPPAEEQHRIVQKVDELMALCDQLEERLNQASETRCQLADTVVEGALR